MRVTANVVIAFLKREIDLSSTVQASLIAIPFLCCSLLLHENVPLRTALVAMVLFIPAERLDLRPALVLVLYMLVVCGIGCIYAVYPERGVLIVVSALLAALTVHLTFYGRDLRTLGTYCYIPILYLGCQLREEHSSRLALRHLVWWSLLAPVLVVAVREAWKQRRPCFTSRSHERHITPSRNHWLSRTRAHYGERNRGWLQDALVMYLAVLIGATIMFSGNFSHPEWGIWSTASIVSGDLDSSLLKAKHRGGAALVGVLLAALLAHWTPHSEWFGLGAAVGVMFTLVALRTYPFAYGTRCFFVTIGAAAAGNVRQVGIPRIENVLIGVSIGLAAVFCAHHLKRGSPGVALASK